MSHIQMFKASDNEDGYISVVCHRERYADELRSLGFVESVDDLKKPAPKKKRAAKKDTD